MRRILIILCLLQSACYAQVFVQAWSGHGHVSSLTVPATPTNGNDIIVAMAYHDTATVTSIQDNNGNPLTLDNHVAVASPFSNVDNHFYYRLNNVSGVTSISIVLSGTSWLEVGVMEVANLVASPLDAVDTVGGVSSPWVTGPIVTTKASDILFGDPYDFNNSTVPTCTSPYLLAVADNGGGAGISYSVCYRIVSSIGTYTPTGTSFDIATAVGISYNGTPLFTGGTAQIGAFIVGP